MVEEMVQAVRALITTRSTRDMTTISDYGFTASGDAVALKLFLPSLSCPSLLCMPQNAHSPH